MKILIRSPSRQSCRFRFRFLLKKGIDSSLEGPILDDAYRLIRRSFLLIKGESLGLLVGQSVKFLFLGRLCLLNELVFVAGW